MIKLLGYCGRPMKAVFEGIANNRINCLLAKQIINNLPDYFWHVPASSSGKYHPEYALGNGGLARHSLSALFYLNMLLIHPVKWARELPGMTEDAIEWINELTAGISTWSEEFDDNQIDLLRIAVMFHDGRKSGTQGDYADNPSTKFDHPIQMANAVLTIGEEFPLEKENCQYIADAIKTHMGKWTTASYAPGIELEKPTTPAQRIVSLADYLASRKYLPAGYDIEI